MRVRLSGRARRDLFGIRTYLAELNPQAARDVIEAIEDAIRFIGEHPLASAAIDDEGRRMKLVPAFGYKIFYRVTDMALVAHVRHPSRSPDWR